ncbi:hypothetical protein GCM10017687_01650 [Streptomyces echinatus]
MVYAPGFERVLEQPLAGVIPVPPEARLVVTEGNYLLLAEGPWARVRPCLDEVWCSARPTRRSGSAVLVARHEEFGKDHAAAVAWVLGTDQRKRRPGRDDPGAGGSGGTGRGAPTAPLPEA